jgi:ketosteroid isomerase-like protein
MEENKQLVLNFWDAFSNSRFDEALAMVAEDATWWVAGTTDISGSFTKAEFSDLVKGIGENAPNGIKITPGHITAEGDRVAMEAESYGEISNGKVYNNFYHMLHTIRDGKLVSVKEYMDTQHVQDVFGN